MATNNGKEVERRVGAEPAVAHTDPPDKEKDKDGTKKKGKFPCLRCKINVTKTSKSVRCNTCEHWVHAECEDMSNELFNILGNPDKFGMLWNCQGCRASAVKLEKLVEKFVKAAEDQVRGVEDRVTQVEKRMDKREAEEEKRSRDLRKEVKEAVDGEREEMEERESRRLNVVFHKIGECPGEKTTGMERIEWDKQSCKNIFDELKLEINIEDIKFCRRLGERGEGPRPMVVGFYLEATRSLLLRNARHLEKTKYKEVNVAPDLTKRQREKEANMKDEASRRNEKLTEDDKAKNLIWAVVGGKGERRLIKTTARPMRGGAATRGRAYRPPSPGMRREDSESESEEERRGPPGPPPAARGRGRPPSKRRERSPEEMDLEPPEKRQTGRT